MYQGPHHLWSICDYLLRIGYIPPKTRYIPQGSPCLSEAKEVPRASPSAFRGFTKALAFPKGYNGSHVPLSRDISYLYHA